MFTSGRCHPWAVSIKRLEEQIRSLEGHELDRRAVGQAVAFVAVMVLLFLLIWVLPRLLGGVVG